MNVTTQEIEWSVGEGIVQAPDGTIFCVEWASPGAYRFEESTFGAGPHPPDLPSISMADPRAFHVIAGLDART
jgi:hypothetical protein